MTRGVCYIHWGSKGDEFVGRSIESVRKYYPDLPITKFHIEEGDKVGERSSELLLEKANVYDFSPYDLTLFLDIDCLVLGNLDYGFEMANKWGMAATISVNPWLKRYPSCTDDSVEYSTGALFFKKDPIIKEVCDLWKHLSAWEDSSITWEQAGELFTVPYQDQLPFSLACHRLNYQPFVLPINWNYTPDYIKNYFGEIKIWHSYKEPNPKLLEVNNKLAPMAYVRFAETGEKK